MKTMQIKDLTLEIGRPKIATPITAVTHEGIKEGVKELIKGPCDILEWRADYYFGEFDNLEEMIESSDAHMKMIRILDDIDYYAEGRPIIFSLTGEGDGGKVSISREHAFDLASLAAQSKLVDFVTLQLFDDDGALYINEIIKQIEEIHGFGARVILSYHEFDRMLSNDEVGNVTRTMRGLGADIPKVCCMAATIEEASQLQDVTKELTSGEQGPVIIIAMGEAGKVTRITGGGYGSCITFAKGNAATAPGQIGADILAKYLDKYYENGGQQ